MRYHILHIEMALLLILPSPLRRGVSFLFFPFPGLTLCLWSQSSQCFEDRVEVWFCFAFNSCIEYLALSRVLSCLPSNILIFLIFWKQNKAKQQTPNPLRSWVHSLLHHFSSLFIVKVLGKKKNHLYSLSVPRKPPFCLKLYSKRSRVTC